jgi:O-acetyl-ADP-ribose deacetylase (regulator of RNase III)
MSPTPHLLVTKGDITTARLDAIVNAANGSLLGGGGVDGAIHRAGGPQILRECRAIRDRQGGCATGQAVITTAGKLPAKHVIHTVGPVWQGGGRGEGDLLGQCYESCLALAREHGLASIAFPNISTGIFRFPKDLAASLALDAVRRSGHASAFERIVFVCFDDENYHLYRALLGDIPE